MSRPRRLALLLLPALLEIFLVVLPGRAQQESQSVRFAFADTTLLRDTLGIHFDRLFPLADSLMITPDSLRAQAIRYRLPLTRIVFLADSLRMPVDSVGTVMERERFNALALSRQRLAKFGYNSGYVVSGGTSTWTNDTDYNLRAGPWFVRNTTSVSLSRSGGSQELSFSQSRASTTELSWEVIRDFSLGARVGLQRNASFSQPATIYDFSKRNDQYQVSLRARPSFGRDLKTEVSLFGGPFSEPFSTYDKSGLNAVLNGRVRYTRGNWLYEDVSVQSTNKFGTARYVGRGQFSTQDYTQDLRSSLSLLENKPASVRLDLAMRKDLAEKPDLSIVTTTRVLADTTVVVADTSDIVRQDPSGNRSADLQLRLRRDQDRFLILDGIVGDNQRLLSDSRNGRFIVLPSSGTNRALSASGRYTLVGWLAEARFSYGVPVAQVPRRDAAHRSSGGDTTVDFREEQRTRARSIEGTLSRQFFGDLTLKATGHVTLSSLRSSVTDSSYRQVVTTGRVQGTFDRDDYEQGYRIEASYSPLQRFSTSLALDVTRRSQLVLPAAGSSRSNEVRSYRANWTWSYRMLPGLTVIQLNQLGADYTHQLFAAGQTVVLSYLTQTNLNAVLSPRLTVQITHRSTDQPNGDFAVQPDGTILFSPSTTRREYALSGSISYSPSAFLTLSVLPYYSATNSETTSGDQAVPSQQQRSLTMSGGANMNLPVTRKGRLIGDIRRSFQAQRSTSFTAGIPTTTPRAQNDYWDGTLRLSWEF
jgi:hypothetical protein